MASRPSIPSYNAGFYSPRRGGNPRYLSLWRGCVGAWCPSLGPTGSRLFDWSLYGNHGTLTNMDAATDWIVSGGQYCLDFDGSNDQVLPSPIYNSGGAISVSCWVYLSSTGLRSFVQKGTLDGNSLSTFALYSYTTLGWSWFTINGSNTLAIVRSTTSHIAGQWVHLVGICGNATIKLYVNGVEEASTTQSGDVKASTQSSYFGGSGSYSYWHNGYLDDIRVYGRVLSPSEIWTLSRRRGIAYELDYGYDAFGSAAAPPAPTSTSNLLLLGVG